MQWPTDVIAAFDEALDIKLMKGATKSEVIQCLLDEAARRAVSRAKADPARLEAAYCIPYTPLGAVSAGGMAIGALKARSITLNPSWGIAVDRLYDLVAENPQLICDHFKDQQVPYGDGM